MEYDNRIKIKDHTNKLETIYKQRRMWLYSSSLVYTAVIFLIFGWNYLDAMHDSKIWWVVISLSLLISVNWWYWTMKSLSELASSIDSEYKILSDITDSIEQVKIILKCREDNNTICNKCPVVGGCSNNKK